MKLKKQLLSQIQQIIYEARSCAVRSVNYERVLMYWHIGKVIFEEEQDGKDRAEYGKFLIQSLLDQLQPEFGSGFSVRQLELCRQFYRTFPIANTLRSQFSWTHYKLLIRIDNLEKRKFYIAETTKNNWSTRQLVYYYVQIKMMLWSKYLYRRITTPFLPVNTNCIYQVKSN